MGELAFWIVGTIPNFWVIFAHFSLILAEVSLLRQRWDPLRLLFIISRSIHFVFAFCVLVLRLHCFHFLINCIKSFYNDKKSGKMMKISKNTTWLRTTPTRKRSKINSVNNMLFISFIIAHSNRHSYSNISIYNL